MSKNPIAAIAAMVVLALGAFVLTACDDDDTSDAQSTDGAFITGMIPHHESAIAMAEVAQTQAEHPEIKQLADEIIAAQDSEIADMNAMHERLFDEPAMGVDHGDLGLDEQMAGMDTMSIDSLEMSRPFDKAFIDEMVPHHQGAIQMARVELAEGEDPEVLELAQSIIDAQSEEIEQMNQWREQWYGAPSPAGGVPPMTDSESMPGMGH